MSLSKLWSDATDFLSSKTALYLAPVAIVGGIYAVKRLRDYWMLPPGPMGLPIIGSLPFLNTKKLHLEFHKLAEKYGPISSVYLGQSLIILVNDYDLCKEMFNLPVYSGRVQNGLVQNLTRKCGIVTTEGEAWSAQRRLSLQILRDFGFAKTLSADLVHEEIEHLEKTLMQMTSNKEVVKLADVFTDSTNRIISALTFGDNLSAEPDEEFKEMSKLFKEFTSQSFLITPAFLFPVLGNFTWLLKRLPSTAKIFKNIGILHEYGLKKIYKRKSLMTAEYTEPLCLCDSYILEQRKAEKAGDFETFKDFQLLRVCVELFFAGTDTTARSLEWLMLYMAAYPDIQEKVNQEISSVIGMEGKVQMKDKALLHYCQAVIDETFRKVSLASLSVFHQTHETTYFQGYKIPSEAILIPFIYSVHHNTNYWDQPNKYNPQRFLDVNGKYRSSPYLMPFSIGKRSCLGESLARMELFLFFVSIMQKFKVELHSDYKDKVDDILNGQLGLLHACNDYKIIISQR